MAAGDGSDGHFRVTTYNVHKGVGTDFRRNPERVLGVIQRLGADIVALQEADRRFRGRPPAIPPDRIGDRLDLRPVDVAGARLGIGHHGNALLARAGLAEVAARPVDLPGLEPRGAIVARAATPLGPVRVAAAHLGLLRRNRAVQIAALCEELAGGTDPVVVLGDLNEWRRDTGHLLLPPGFRLLRPGPSFPSRRPMAALDGIILGPGVEAVARGVHRSAAARRASDHLPVWADLRLSGG